MAGYHGFCDITGLAPWPYLGVILCGKMALQYTRRVVGNMPVQHGTHLGVLSESYPMNTNMTEFK